VIWEGLLEKVTFILRSEGSERAGYAFIVGGIWKEKRESRMPWNEVLVMFQV